MRGSDSDAEKPSVLLWEGGQTPMLTRARFQPLYPLLRLPPRYASRPLMSSSGESDAKRARTDAAPDASAASAVVLHSYWRSSCSYRVRIALGLKRVAYEYRAVHLVKDGGEQLLDTYAALNPMREVPALTIDGVCLTQSQGACGDERCSIRGV